MRCEALDSKRQKCCFARVFWHLRRWRRYHQGMFSYRHAFHAGNHADVIKHLTLIATLQHLQQKEGGITIVDTHAGAGLYRLDGDYSETGGEAKDGIFKLLSVLDEAAGKKDAKPVPEALQAYLDMIASFNPNGQAKFYPGSPFILHAMLRKDARDMRAYFQLNDECCAFRAAPCNAPRPSS